MKEQVQLRSKKRTRSAVIVVKWEINCPSMTRFMTIIP